MIGSTLGKYRLVASLGRGGMGEVYRADDLELGQSVALKFLPPGVATDPRELSRFRNARAENRELQTLLLARGHDIGAADGLIGDKTRAAIRQEQQRLGLKTDGRAGQKLLDALRRP